MAVGTTDSGVRFNVPETPSTVSVFRTLYSRVVLVVGVTQCCSGHHQSHNQQTFATSLSSLLALHLCVTHTTVSQSITIHNYIHQQYRLRRCTLVSWSAMCRTASHSCRV
jgi:hypothetical protein